MYGRKSFQHREFVWKRALWERRCGGQGKAVRYNVDVLTCTCLQLISRKKRRTILLCLECRLRVQRGNRFRPERGAWPASLGTERTIRHVDVKGLIPRGVLQEATNASKPYLALHLWNFVVSRVQSCGKYRRCFAARDSSEETPLELRGS